MGWWTGSRDCRARPGQKAVSLCRMFQREGPAAELSPKWYAECFLIFEKPVLMKYCRSS